jgi:DNA (cytosine-5)-methyltransferase 1
MHTKFDPQKLRFLDVFSGCGGLSYGLEKAGHECVGAIDRDKDAIDTFNLNHSRAVGLCKDLLNYYPKDFERQSGVKSIDLIVGGPPCQGFSTAKRTGGGNNGPTAVLDSRRELYKVFLRYVAHYEPKMFVMENVLGIRSTASGHYFTAIQNEARNLGYNVSPVELRCWEFGVPQARVRQIFVGTKVGLAPFAPELYLTQTHFTDNPPPGKQRIVTLGEAICDLPALDANSGSIESDYDLDLRAEHIERYGMRYTYDVLQANHTKLLTWHVARMHSERDLRDFDRLAEGQTSKKALAAGIEMEFPYDRETFKDRYTRQHRDQLCSTIVAHLRRDGLMFIHPTQRRSLTPREAARVQSFPDTFKFSGQRGPVYQQIGNAVPPEAGRAIGLAIAKYLLSSAISPKPQTSKAEQRDAIQLLEELINSLYLGRLQSMDNEEFSGVWRAVHVVKPSIHPDNALDRSGPIQPPSHGVSLVLEPYYLRSGWPHYLIPIAEEALKRYRSGDLTAHQYYFQGDYSSQADTEFQAASCDEEAGVSSS